MNLLTIADALAARFVSVTATNGTETETATATAYLPDQVSTLALLVYPPQADLSLIMGPRLDDHYRFVVRLLRDPVSTPARTKWLYAWATALRTKVQGNIDLDVAGVVEARATGMRLELDGETYSSPIGVGAFDVVELSVDVHVQENTSASI